MNAFDYSKKYATCAVCGDIHGEFDFLVGKMLRMELTDTLVIVAGDCGIGFDTPGYYRRTYQRIAKILKKLTCGLLLIRGNHDDPEYFQRERIVFPRMRTLPDYSVIRFKDHTILCIGGATHRHGCYPYRPLVLLPHDQKRNRDVDGLRSESGKGYR